MAALRKLQGIPKKKSKNKNEVTTVLQHFFLWDTLYYEYTDYACILLIYLPTLWKLTSPALDYVCLELV